MEPVRSPLLAEAGFHHGFTTRAGGVSEGPYESLSLAHDVGDDAARVAANLEIARDAVGRGLPLARARQIHGCGVAMADEVLLSAWTAPPVVEADALISGRIPAVLAVQTADCAAVLLADPETRMVAAVHAGWRGTAGGVIRNTVKRMASMGAAPAGLLAAIGPCICQACYEVGEDVARRLPESADPVRGKPGMFTLDLANAVEVSLIAAGLTTSNIHQLRLCTACDDRFFSHRASGGACGRNLGFIEAGKSKGIV